ncbi:MAG: hypothetical protein ACXAAM_07620 [Candidatus Heimdallarchaeaceae archaeon]
MTRESRKRIFLIILYSIIVIGSVYGLFIGSFGLYWSYGFVALIIVSAIAFIGAIFGLSYEMRFFGKKIIWVVVAFVSVAVELLISIKGLEWLNYRFGIFLILICLSAGLILFSIFWLVFNRRRREDKINDI